MKFTKKITSIILAGGLLLNSIGCFAVETGRVKCDILNVRVSPNTNCEIIDRLSAGTTFEIVYTDNGWYNIKMNDNVTGFVCADYVSRMIDGIPSEDESADSTATKTAAAIAKNAHNYIGYPYSYGSTGPSAFDCSGFTTYLYKQQGYSLPRTSREQGEFGTYVEKSDLSAGDLVFFSNRSDRVINHVGIYIGNNEFIHASTSIRGVVKDSLDTKYYIKNYVTARRVL